MTESVKERLGRIHEKHVRVPALQAAAARKNGYISTSELIQELENQFRPDGEDAEILDNRNDSKFSQIVRNLKSHKSASTNIFAKGYAEEVNDGIKITDAGRAYLASFSE